MYIASLSVINKICLLPRNPGPCRAYMPMYYFNAFQDRCEKFIYGGCGGNANRFESLHECRQTCICGKFICA